MTQMVMATVRSVNTIQYSNVAFIVSYIKLHLISFVQEDLIDRISQ